MAHVYRDLNKRKAPVGLSSIGYLIATEDIATWGKINDANASTAGANAIVDTEHIPAVGKKFIKIYHNTDRSQLMAETVGERDSERLFAKAEIMVPGNDAELAEFSEEVLGKDYLLLLKEPQCKTGEIIQVGTECNPVRLRPKFESGTATGGVKGWTFEAESREKFYFYTGAITLEPVEEEVEEGEGEGGGGGGGE
jgi:hypothetical protein